MRGGIPPASRGHTRRLSDSLFALVRHRVFVLLEAGDDSAASWLHVRTEFAHIIAATGRENLTGRTDHERYRQASNP
jgi:hypothetical protein